MEWRELLAEAEAEVQQRVSGRGRNAGLWGELKRRLHTLALTTFAGASWISPEDREDLVQDVLVKLQDALVLRRARRATSGEGYLRTMLRNAGYDLARRREVEGKALARLHYWPQPIFHPVALERREMRTRLLEELRRLRPEEQRLIRMRFWDGLTIREIAAKMRVRYSAAAVRLFRLTRRLAERLQEDSAGRV